jgi:hypothetical protein
MQDLFEVVEVKYRYSIVNSATIAEPIERLLFVGKLEFCLQYIALHCTIKDMNFIIKDTDSPSTVHIKPADPSKKYNEGVVYFINSSNPKGVEVFSGTVYESEVIVDDAIAIGYHIVYTEIKEVISLEKNFVKNFYYLTRD